MFTGEQTVQILDEYTYEDYNNNVPEGQFYREAKLKDLVGKDVELKDKVKACVRPYHISPYLRLTLSNGETIECLPHLKVKRANGMFVYVGDAVGLELTGGVFVESLVRVDAPAATFYVHVSGGGEFEVAGVVVKN